MSDHERPPTRPACPATPRSWPGIMRAMLQGLVRRDLVAQDPRLPPARQFLQTLVLNSQPNR